MASTSTKIQWAESTWNPVRGCALVSPGCTNCYAMRQAHRHSGPGGAYEGLTRKSGGRPVWTGRARLVPEALDEPLRWRAPRRVFVNSMSDLFHEDLTNEEIAAVFGVMAAASRHTFQILTKRAERMRDWFRWVAAHDAGDAWTNCHWEALQRDGEDEVIHRRCDTEERRWPLPNVWIGVSVEDQQRADERIPELLETPAAVRWVSLEPQLEDVDLGPYLARWTCDICGNPRSFCESKGICGAAAAYTRSRGLDWVVCGGESGPKARPWCTSWGANVVHDCEETETPLFMKQLGARAYDTDPDAAEVGDDGHWPVHRWLELKDKKGGRIDEWPEYLRVRQWPEVRA